MYLWISLFTGESASSSLDGDVLLASGDGQLQRGRVSAVHGEKGQPLRHHLLPTFGPVRRGQLGLLSHPLGRHPGQDGPPRHPLSRPRQHLQRNHHQFTKGRRAQCPAGIKHSVVLKHLNAETQ